MGDHSFQPQFYTQPIPNHGTHPTVPVCSLCTYMLYIYQYMYDVM